MKTFLNIVCTLCVVDTSVQNVLVNLVFDSGLDKMVLLWDLSNGELVAQFKGHTDSVYTLCFSREGSLLASGKTAFIFVLQNEKVTRVISSHYGKKSWKDKIQFKQLINFIIVHINCSNSKSYRYSTSVLRQSSYSLGGMDNCVKLWDTAKLWDDLSEDGVTTTVNT